jgi:chemotaxis protein CheY-P-specific phosphatase CheC
MITPPKYIQDAAKKGLELLRAGKGGDGLTEGTKAAARSMAAGDISEEKIIKASAWGARHKVDLESPNNSNPKDKDYPAAGAVAHFLWGINPLNPQPARDWFDRQSEKIKNEKSFAMKTTSTNNIDEAKSTISGVSLISLGEARGHISNLTGAKIMVDGTTLTQVFECCQNEHTVKVKLDHGSGVLSTIGYVDNFELESNRVTADLHIYDSEPEAPRLFEIAEKNPAHMGISLEFLGLDEERMDGNCYARCSEVLTAALVSDPAANKTLFFSSKRPAAALDKPKDLVLTRTKPHPLFLTSKEKNTTSSMKKFAETEIEITSPDTEEDNGGDSIQKTLEDIQTALASHMADYAAFKSAYEQSVIDINATPGSDPKDGSPETLVSPDTKATDKKMAEDPKDEKKMEEDAKSEKEKEMAKAAQMGAEIAIRHLSGKFGAILPHAGAPSTAPKKRLFSEIVSDETKRFDGDGNKAMLHCIKNFSKEYAESRNVR